MAGGFQDALVSKGLDPELVHRHPNPEERRAQRIDQFVDLLRRSLGASGDAEARGQEVGNRRIAARASARVTSPLR